MQSSQKYTLIKWIRRKDSLHHIKLTVNMLGRAVSSISFDGIMMEMVITEEQNDFQKAQKEESYKTGTQHVWRGELLLWIKPLIITVFHKQRW